MFFNKKQFISYRMSMHKIFLSQPRLIQIIKYLTFSNPIISRKRKDVYQWDLWQQEGEDSNRETFNYVVIKMRLYWWWIVSWNFRCFINNKKKKGTWVLNNKNRCIVSLTPEKCTNFLLYTRSWFSLRNGSIKNAATQDVWNLAIESLHNWYNQLPLSWTDGMSLFFMQGKIPVNWE